MRMRSSAAFIFFLTTLIMASILSSPPAQGEIKMVKITILPWRLNAPGEAGYLKDALYDLTASRIGVEERIAVVERSLVDDVLSAYEGRGLTNDDLIDIGRETEADYVFQGSLSFIADTLSLDVKVVKVEDKGIPILSVSQGRGMDSLIPLIGRMALDINERVLVKEGLTPTVKGFGGSPQYVGTFGKEKQKGLKEREDFIIVSKGKEETEKVWKSESFSSNIKGLAIGDFDGDGRNEVALIDDNNLRLYRRTADTMELLWEEEGGANDINLYVDAADINKNGFLEIYVTRISGGRVASYILEYDGKGYKKVVTGIGWFLRVIKDGEIESLVGQRGSSGEFFLGKVVKLVWKGEGVSEEGAIDLPEGVNIFGFVYTDLKGERGVAALDEGDRLVVYIKKDMEWTEVWKGEGLFGGTLNAVALTSKGFSPLDTKETELMGIVEIKGRILFADLNNDGYGEVIINRNVSPPAIRYFKRLKSYKQGEIVSLEWDGISLEENWRTKTLEGYIADYRIDDIDNDGGKDLVMVLVTDGGVVSKDVKSIILSYKLITK